MKTQHPPRRQLSAVLIATVFAPAWAQAQQVQQAEAQQITITGIGRGQSRQVEVVTAAELKQLPPGSSPLQAVARLPSVNFQSADAFGAYEWSTRITVRGFNQNQLGFTLDDVPLGDMSYANFNGLHISRAVATENIARAVLSAGTGSLSTASSSNLGGTLQFYSADPAKTFGGEGNVGLGSHKDSHVFAKLETGEMGFGRAYVSVSDQRSEKWKGSGDQKQQQFSAKFLTDIGSGQLRATANVSRRAEIDYQDMSLDMINRLGQNFDNTYPDFKAAVKIATTLCGNTVSGVASTYSAACDEAYYAGSGLRNDELYTLGYEGAVAGGVTAKVTGYHHHNKGMGLWYTPYTASPDGTPVSVRTTEYAINRDGLVASADVAMGVHNLRAGLWLENNKFDQARRFYAASPVLPSPYDFPSNPFFTQWQYAFKTTTTQFSLEDALELSRGVMLNFGFKSLSVKTTAAREVGDPASNPQGDITARKGFLPQIGLSYALDKSNELFAGYAQNMRAYQSSRTGLSPFSTTQVGFNAISGGLKPETSQTVEGGWRLNSREVEAVVAAYAVQFKDRLLAIQQGPGIVGNPAVLANVGNAQLLGLEASASFRLGGGISWYNGLSLNKSQYKSDYTSNGVTYPTNGKTIVDTPAAMLKSVFSYDSSTLFANLGVDYMAKRYYTYLNQGDVAGRTLLNTSVGYRLGGLAGLKDLTVQLTVNNLTNQKYISTLGSNGFVNSDPKGTEQTILPGAPRSMFISLSAKV
jgi:iron complex outermembrane receptor protein